MKSAVFVGFVLFALVPLINAYCWQELLKFRATHCQDDVDKTWHGVGSSWTNSRCDQCSCSRVKSCCSGLPSVNVPDDCTVEFDYNACTYEVFNKKDRNIKCNYSAVGK